MRTRQKRSLSHVGGRTVAWGDPHYARTLAHCLDVDRESRLPLTHGFHAYPARMHPEIARRVLARFGGQGRILDPFVGSGTTALEAMVVGRAFVGVDISRVALEIAWTRTRVWRPDDVRRVEREGHRIARLAWESPAPPVSSSLHAHAEWFAPHTLAEVATLKRLIEETPTPDIRRILTVVLSSILVKVSRQESDSIAARTSSDDWPPGSTPRLFRDKCSELTKQLLMLSSHLHKQKIPATEPDLRLADARTVALEPRPDDLVLTSPPYPGTYDYVLHHRLRFPLFEDDASFATTHEIGAKRTFDKRRYRLDTRTWLVNVLPARIILLVGDSAQIQTDRLFRDIASEVGAHVVAGASQQRPDWSVGRRGASRREHLLLVEPRPTARVTVGPPL